jgi:hypothetical protein
MNEELRLTVAVIAEDPNLQELQEEFGKTTYPDDLVQVQLVDLQQPISVISRQVRRLHPDIVFLGQTVNAENILSRLNITPSPLIVRWSMYYGTDRPVYTARTPSHAGFHLDIPKCTQTIRSIVENGDITRLVKLRDSTLPSILPKEVRAFDGFRNWVEGRGTPMPNFGWPWYFDHERIDDLFAQMANRPLIDNKERCSEDAARKSRSQEELRVIMEALDEANALLDLDPPRIEDIQETTTSTFVHFCGWFDTRVVRQAVSSGDRFVYFGCSDFPIVLGSALDRFGVGLNHVVAALGSTESQLRVFGELTPMGNSFYLEPYAFGPEAYRKTEEPIVYPELGTLACPRSLRVFLCHSSDDKPVVRDLYRCLIADNVDAWLDEEKLVPGDDWNLEITRAVRNSDVVIVCLSRNSVNKVGYVQKELRQALDISDEQPEGKAFLIPLKLDECDVPDRLRRYQWVEFFREDGYKRLIRALQRRAKEGGLAVPHLVYRSAARNVNRSDLEQGAP